MTEGVSERLVTAIREGGITQGTLASQIGATQAAVSQWCTGKKSPTNANIDAISAALGIHSHWLQSGVGPMRVVDSVAQRVDYSRDAFWGFRRAPEDGGRDFGNANVWSFEPTIEVLVREVLQNALDAIVPGGSQVQVVFRLIELRNGDLQKYQKSIKWKELHQHLDASTHNRQKLGSLIKDGLESLEESGHLMLLVIEDSGTTGLLGPESGDGKFAALCRNNLDSNKEGTATKGGAFGLGKGVLWRASRFAAVMFCSNLSHPSEAGLRNHRLIGRCDLPWHEVEGEAFAGPSWFGQPHDANRSFAVSFWDNDALARDLYLGREDLGSGTSACVVGFHDPSSDRLKSARELAEEIEKAAATHFFPALSSGKLSVSVKTYGGRADYDKDAPITSAEVDARQLQPEFWRMLQALSEDSFAETLKTPGEIVRKPVSLSLPSRKVDPKHPEYEHEAVLLVRYAPEDEAGTECNRLAMFRGPGMVVSERKLGGICLGSRPFHALLLCGAAAGDQPADLAADEFLRTAEPPSHNKWMATPELKAAYTRGCVSKLDAFLEKAIEVLRDLVKPVSRDLGNGPNSLRELFRVGTEPVSVAKERPRVIAQQGEVDKQGRWNVEARVRMKPNAREVLMTPAVLFVAETGGGQPVLWESIEAISNNCAVEGHQLRVQPGTREVHFRGTTDRESHPVPANESSVVVDLRRVIVVPKGTA
ncbi:MAG: helix-turn-helix transcriptional regulator [Pirellulales bacterium]|nr:helix-turn-helix transcriptional regulator [Pirellulales bacterium]